MYLMFFATAACKKDTPSTLQKISTKVSTIT